MISINHEIKANYVLIETELEKTNQVILGFEKELIYSIVTEKYSRQYINRQRRINALKSPFRRVREILQDALGENMEKIRIDEVLDLGTLENEKKRTWQIISNFSYIECVTYLGDVKKHGLKRANNIWEEKVIQRNS